MCRVVCALSAIAILAGSACGSSIEMKYDSLAFGTAGTHTVKVTASSAFLAGNKSSLTVYAGPLNHQMRNGTGSLAQFSGQTIATFCTELSQAAKTSWLSFDAITVEEAPRPMSGAITGGMGSAKADAIRLLWAGVGDAKFTDALTAAAFQIAVWEIIYDGPTTFDLTGGDISFTAAKVNGVASPATLTLAGSLFTTYVANADNNSLRQGGLVALSSEYGQDQLIVIPLPAGSAMAMAGMLGLAGIRRRRSVSAKC